jgi:hypothetical protein
MPLLVKLSFELRAKSACQTQFLVGVVDRFLKCLQKRILRVGPDQDKVGVESFNILQLPGKLKSKEL